MTSDAPDALVTSETPEPSAGPVGDVLATLSDDQRETWLKTGDLPTTEPPTSPPDNPETPEPEPTETVAPVDAAPDASVTPAPKPRTDINARLGQMAEQRRVEKARADRAEADLAALRAERAERTAPAAGAARETAAVPAYLDLVRRYQADPEWPTIEAAAAAGFDDPYAAAVAAQAAFVQQRHVAERDQASAHQTRVDRAQARIDAAFTAARALPTFNQAALETVPYSPALAETIFESDLSGPLLNYFSEHPTEGRAIAAMEPFAAARAIGKLESQLSAVSSTPATSPKTVSSAPDPVLTLGARHTASGDDLDEAIRSNDVSRFMRLQNARELQEQTGGRR